MRYAIAGVNVTVLDDVSTLHLVALMGENIPTGRTLWLRSAWAYNPSAAITLQLWDGTTGSIATASTATLKMEFGVASAQATAVGTLTMVEIPTPGLKFKTGGGVVLAATVANATSEFTVGRVGGTGYYE